MTFKILKIPIKPKRNTYKFSVGEHNFKNKPLSKWLDIINEYIKMYLTFNDIWDAENIDLGNIYVRIDNNDYDYDATLMVEVVVLESNHAFGVRKLAWKTEMDKWNEWATCHADEINIEKERIRLHKENARLIKLKKEATQAEQKALRARRKLEKIINLAQGKLEGAE